MLKTILLSILIFASSVTYALVAGPSRVEGKVKGFDEKIVNVENDKVTYEVPREFVSSKTLKVGSQVEILLTNEQLPKIKVQEKSVKKK